MSVWMCPGQGAQKPGMGADLLQMPTVMQVFEATSEAMGLDLIEASKSATQEELNGALLAPAMTFAISVGLGLACKERGLVPDALVGFSLGQISALVLADILCLEDALKLLKVRSEAMAQACHDAPGAMAAVLGGTEQEVAELCGSCAQGQILVPANFNSPGQIVVSGQDDALERAIEAWKAEGKKAIKLATAGAFHSPLMQGASEEVGALCQELSFAEPSIPLICNTDARPFECTRAAERLQQQVVQGVMFDQSIRYLIEQGQTTFVEMGYGKTLTGLVRRIDKDTVRQNVGTYEQFCEFCAEHGVAC